jgi:glycosyltransferase involved in cell wall biosynthesis
MVGAIHTTVNVTRRFELFDQVLYRRLIAKCRRVIFVCEAQANYWKSKYPALASTSVVVYNGVDIDYFCRAQFVRAGEELKIRLEIPHYAPVVTCIAGFRQEKGHQYLIEAFTKLSGEPYLVLVGDGELRKAIEKIVESSPCQRRIIFLGEVADVRPILAATDVSVLASTAVETFSMAMLESMAMEVPMVATDIGGLSEAILPRQTGELVPPRNADKLAQVLSSYICNRQMVREIGKHARVNVTKQFSSDVMIRRTAAVLVEMVA